MKIRVRPRMCVEAEMWQGDPVAGFDRVNGDGGLLLLMPSLDGKNIAVVGDWLITPREGVTFCCPAGMFEETYEVMP